MASGKKEHSSKNLNQKKKEKMPPSQKTKKSSLCAAEQNKLILRACQSKQWIETMEDQGIRFIMIYHCPDKEHTHQSLHRALVVVV
jgi:hypothetical protein